MIGLISSPRAVLRWFILKGLQEKRRLRFRIQTDQQIDQN